MKIKIERFFVVKGRKQIKHCSRHHFSGASKEGYGHMTYFRTVDENDDISFILVMRSLIEICICALIGIESCKISSAANLIL